MCMPLIRSIGRWTLTALVVNAIVGSSIFGLPSELTRLLGRASPIAMLVAAAIVSIIIACMAEVASQFTETGGPYLYVRSAFGRFAGLQVGWFWILASIGGGAGCANLFVQYLGSIWHPAAEAGVRIAIITLLIAVPAVANYFGVRSGANLSNTLTVAKLLPLVLLIVLGLVRFSRQPQLISAVEFTHPGSSAWLRALLLLTFAYSGFENAMAPGAEVENPRRTMPFALATGLIACAILYALIQFVTVATIGTRASEYPLADTASLLLRHGGLFVAIAVMMSTYGWLAGDILLSPRIVYSFAETGDAPHFLAKIHSGFHTPALAMLVYAALTWMLAVTGTFLWVAAIAGASSLILYIGVCASLIRLRKLAPNRDAFRVPFGPALAVVAICISLALITALDTRQVLLMSVTGLLATANWWWAKHHALRQRQAPEINATSVSK
jgi:basic amino acid/polyamine antiporter, APA family